jgi:LuxR family maltose regulon positive regulatory protein
MTGRSIDRGVIDGAETSEASPATRAVPVGTLLTTKLLRPRVPPHYVERTQVSAMLDLGTQGPVTNVSAGAGWGKTLTTAAWAAAGPAAGPVAWVSLDETDNEPRSFWSYVLAALRGAAVVPESNPLSGLDPGLGREDENLRRLTTGLAELPEPVVLVLDDFHLMRSGGVLEGMSALLQRPIPQLRWVLLTRADPELPLHRLRLSGDLLEIRSRDLAFDLVETSSLLALDDVPVDREQTERIISRTEGWPAGLRLASLFLRRGGPDHTAAHFTGDDRAVADYLLEEVLASQTPELRRFLLRTSVMERLTGDLAEVLTDTPGGQQTLETLERANAFVVGLEGEDRPWFRYHPLLRDMLQHQLRVEDPRAEHELHTRAASWLATQGHVVESLRHALAASDWTLFGHLFVTRATPMLVSADRMAIGHVLARVPPERFTDSPEMALCGAGLSFHRGEVLAMQRYLAFAEKDLAGPSGDEHLGATVALHLLRTAVSRGKGDASALVTDAGIALDLVTGRGLSLPAGAEYRAVALSNLGTGLVWTGHWDQAERTLEEALLAVEHTSLEAARINVLGHLALVHVAGGRLRQAFRNASAAIELLEARGWAPLPQASAAYLALALVHIQWNNQDAARDLLRSGRADTIERTVQFALALAEIRLDASAHRVERAREELTRLRRSADGWTPSDVLTGWLRQVDAEVHLAAGDPTSALEILRPEAGRQTPIHARLCMVRALVMTGALSEARALLTPVPEGSFGDGAVIAAWLLAALLADRGREDNRALYAMSRAVRAAVDEGVRRPFLTLDPERVSRLLSHYSSPVEEERTFVAGILLELNASKPKGSGPAPLTDDLTDRELSVLRHLPSMMTNIEIAAVLFVSVNTVKAHLKRIYLKLEVTNRRDAVHRARELGLLPV